MSRDSSPSPPDRPIADPERGVHAWRGMPAQDGNGRRDPTVVTAQLTAAERMAAAIVLAFELCDEQGAPLTQEQKVAVVEAALMEFDGFEAHLSGAVSLGTLLRGLRLDQVDR